MNEPFVTIETLHDPLEAEILADLLRENGITTRVVGTQSASLIGVGQNILALRLEVAERDAEAARALAESFLEGRGEELLRAEGVISAEEETEEESETAAPHLPTRGLAAAWTLFLFGGSHSYTRQWFAGALLGAGVCVALWATAVHGVAGLVALLTLLLLDALGGQVAFGRGAPVPVQLLAGVGFLGVGAAAFALADGLWGPAGTDIRHDIDLGWVLLTSPALAFGLWLWPKWRRARQQRHANRSQLTLGNRFARVVWLALNSWSSIAIGLFFLWLMAGQALTASAEARATYLRAQLTVTCGPAEIVITNNSHDGVVEIRSAVILRGGARSRYELGPDGERIYLPPPRHELDLSRRRLELASGAAESVSFTRATEGPCATDDPLCRVVDVQLAGSLGAESYSCALWQPAVRDPGHDSPFILDLGLPLDDLWLPER